MIKNIMVIVGLIGLAIAALALPISIGYGLYIWAGGLTIALAAWTAFKALLVCLFGGMIVWFAAVMANKSL
ncbi:hypothetical protein D3C75_1172210 [compost metagenome]